MKYKNKILILLALFTSCNFITANGKLNELNHKNKNLETIIKEHDLVIVDFWATWCNPCKRMTPELEKIARQYTNIYILKINIDEFPAIATEYGISSLPTLVFFKHKNTSPVAIEVGSKTFNDIKTRIDRYFK